MRRILEPFRNTFLHPQWLSLRYHRNSRRYLREIAGCRVLDIGSGDSEQYALMGPDCQLLRLDYPATNASYRHLPDIYANAAMLPVREGAMDVVLLLEVLEHVPDDGLVLREIHRVLKAGGRLYISVPFVYPLHDVPADFRRYTLYGLRLLLDRAGFVPGRELYHGNSFVTALQLFNLSLMEMARDIHFRRPIAGWLLAILFYPLCISVNLLACPFLFMPGTRASCLGYFFTAIRK